MSFWPGRRVPRALRSAGAPSVPPVGLQRRRVGGVNPNSATQMMEYQFETKPEMFVIIYSLDLK